MLLLRTKDATVLLDCALSSARAHPAAQGMRTARRICASAAGLEKLLKQDGCVAPRASLSRARRRRWHDPLMTDTERYAALEGH
jgi:hypothetical protein